MASFLARFPALATEPARTLVIASEERSGSEYLCQMMGACGRLGRPSEYLNAWWMRRFLPDWPEDVPAQLALAWRAGTDADGHFAIKLHWPQFQALATGMAGRGGWRAALPGALFLRLARRDLLGQAISLYRARQSGRYHAHMPALREAGYDAAAIAAMLREILAYRASWQGFLAAHAIVPVEIAYEDLAADPWPAMEAIAWAAGVRISRAAIHPPRPLGVQRDATTEQWRARFLADMAERDDAAAWLAIPPAR
ncbi:MAG: hypothetical protein KGL12_14230 [Rhodospirillales bacterium]|nr:hypothetical protein [Rhodospirillales bacterium]